MLISVICREFHKEKIADFGHKSGKLAIQMKDDYYINWKNTQIRRILIIFPKIWTRKAWIISLMQNEGKIDNRKIMIMFWLIRHYPLLLKTALLESEYLPQ